MSITSLSICYSAQKLDLHQEKCKWGYDTFDLIQVATVVFEPNYLILVLYTIC